MFIVYAAAIYAALVLLALGLVVCFSSGGGGEPLKFDKDEPASGDVATTRVVGDLPDIVAPRRRYAAPPTGLSRHL